MALPSWNLFLLNLVTAVWWRTFSASCFQNCHPYLNIWLKIPMIPLSVLKLPCNLTIKVVTEFELLLVVTWICQNCEMDLIRLLHGFVNVVKCFSRPNQAGVWPMFWNLFIGEKTQQGLKAQSLRSVVKIYNVLLTAFILPKRLCLSVSLETKEALQGELSSGCTLWD